jgi:CBS domain
MRARPPRLEEMSAAESQVHTARPVVYRGEALRASAEARGGARIEQTRESADGHLAMTDSGAQLVTGFVWERPLTAPEKLSIDAALLMMLRAGVQALLVVRDDVVTGLITAYDIQGERPLQFLAQSGYRRHDEIEVGHIMTPWERVPTFDFRALGRARVRDLVAFFRRTAATHLVLVQQIDHRTTAVRALIARTWLERQLRQPI